MRPPSKTVKMHNCPRHGQERCGVADPSGSKCGFPPSGADDRYHACSKGPDAWIDYDYVGTE
jgi:hypothetical protein